MVIGDMNANTGESREGLESILGPWTNPVARNKPGDMLIDLCRMHNLVITNTFFRHKALHRDTFRGHKVDATPKLIDYVLINRKFRSSIFDTRVFREVSSVIDSDHEFVLSKVRLRLKARNQQQQREPRLDISALITDSKLRRVYKDTVYQGFLEVAKEDPVSEPDNEISVEAKWAELKKVVLTAARDVLPEEKRCARIPWFT